MLKFVVDVMLGKLVKELRILGYDTLYYRGEGIHDLIQLARQQDRVILTRNARLLSLSTDVRIIRLSEDTPSGQVRELLQREKITPQKDSFFSRCLLCNALLEGIPREETEGKSLTTSIMNTENSIVALGVNGSIGLEPTTNG